MKIARGVLSAALDFLVIGVVLPLALDYLSPLISSYVSLPPSSSRWLAFILFGALFAVTGFLQNGYSKGDFPWLFGKIGGGLVGLGFFYYLFLLLPSSSGSTSVESTGLLLLIVLAIALSYGYLILDFIDARQRKSKQVAPGAKAGGPLASGGTQ
ncbi:MAG: hypothetical protein OK455_03170 [Thaumarchaeota archaeon]|nr:hypothetical protein [Nitrososphaerota archaeon]